MSLARKLELREQYVAPAPRAAPRGLLAAPPQRLALPAPPGANPPALNIVTVEGRPIKRLSTAEQEECRRLGLCYNYDEKYTRGHNRVCRRIFYIDGVEITNTDDAAAAEGPDIETPIFSLHAVAGVLICDTM